MMDQYPFECFECGAFNLLETMGYDEQTGLWGLCSECEKPIDFERNGIPKSEQLSPGALEVRVGE